MAKRRHAVRISNNTEIFWDVPITSPKVRKSVDEALARMSQENQVLLENRRRLLKSRQPLTIPR